MRRKMRPGKRSSKSCANSKVPMGLRGRVSWWSEVGSSREHPRVAHLGTVPFYGGTKYGCHPRCEYTTGCGRIDLSATGQAPEETTSARKEMKERSRRASTEVVGKLQVNAEKRNKEKVIVMKQMLMVVA